MYTRIQFAILAMAGISLTAPNAMGKMSDIKPLKEEGIKIHNAGKPEGTELKDKEATPQQIIAQVGETIIHILGPCGAEPACLAAAPENGGNADFASSVTNHAPNVGEQTVPTPAGPQSGALNAVYYWGDAQGSLKTLDQPMFANNEYQDLRVDIRNGTNPNPRHAIAVTGPNGEAIDLVNFGGLEGGVTKSVQLAGMTGRVTFQCQIHAELSQAVTMVTPDNNDVIKDKELNLQGGANDSETVWNMTSPVHQFMSALDELMTRVQAFVG